MFSSVNLYVVGGIILLGLIPLTYKMTQVYRHLRMTHTSRAFHDWLFNNDIRIAVRFIINARRSIVFKKVGNPSVAKHAVSVMVRVVAKVNGKKTQFDAMYCFTSTVISVEFWKDKLLLSSNLERLVVSDLSDIGVLRVLSVKCLSTADNYPKEIVDSLAIPSDVRHQLLLLKYLA